MNCCVCGTITDKEFLRRCDICKEYFCDDCSDVGLHSDQVCENCEDKYVPN